MKIGVLALQGCVEPHRPHIEAAGAGFAAVKTPQQFDAVDAFILPGGESTTMLKLIDTYDLWDSLARNFAAKPVWGICAGAILMSETVLVTPKVSSRPSAASGETLPRMSYEDPSTSLRSAQDDNIRSEQKSFGLLPITVQRNAYGRQLDSHHGMIDGYPVSFIRAPVITALPPLPPRVRGRSEAARSRGGDLEILATHENTPVWIQQGPYMATTFHPELTQDFPSPMHRAFVDLVRRSAAQYAA